MLANTNHGGGCTDTSPARYRCISVDDGQTLVPKSTIGQHLQMQDTSRLEGVGGNPVPTLGPSTVGVGIGNGVYKAIVVVSARKEGPKGRHGNMYVPKVLKSRLFGLSMLT